MSDLAPFVAANIRDKVVLDLQNENENLREEIRNLPDELSNRVKVTGANGIPLYASANISSAEVSLDGELRTRTLTLENDPSHRPMSAGEIQNTEMYVGLLKQPLSLGRWEMGPNPTMVREEEQGRYFEVHFRDWQTEFEYPEILIEVGPYEQDQDIYRTVDSIRQLFRREAGRRPVVVPTVRFLKFYLHEPTEATLARFHPRWH